MVENEGKRRKFVVIWENWEKRINDLWGWEEEGREGEKRGLLVIMELNRRY